jgi:type VII secretion protein EssB
MGKITDGTMTFEVEQLSQNLQVTLEANQYELKKMNQLTGYLQSDGNFLKGEVQAVSDEQLVLMYTLPKNAQSVFSFTEKLDELGRLELTRQFSNLIVSSEFVHSLLHPENLFVSAGQILIAHRGVKNFLAPQFQTEAEVLNAYQALVTSTLLPKYSFETLVSGQQKIRDHFAKAIFETESVEAIQGLIEQQYQTSLQRKLRTERSVKKGRYAFLKWTSPLLVLAAVGLGIGLSVTLTSTLPRQQALTNSETAYIQTNYDQATTTLQSYTPESLPKANQYVLASSFVHLENLTNDQKSAILNNLSMNSSANELLYWIYIGRGNFNKGLSLAQNIGDNQLILNAYTKLYDATNANTTMSGSQKQSDLSNYKQEIDKYVKLLGGTGNGN